MEELAGEAWCQPGSLQGQRVGPMMGDIPYGVAARRPVRRSSPSEKGDPRPRGLPSLVQLYWSTLHPSRAAPRNPKVGSRMGFGGGGAAVGPHGLLPGRVLQRFVEQIIDEDGVVLAVVDVPVICTDKFLQFLFFGVEVPQLQFTDRVAESSLPWRFHSCSSWRKWTRSLTCPLVCNDRSREQ